MRWAVLGCVYLVGLPACGGSPTPEASAAPASGVRWQITSSQWQEARNALGELRGTFARRPPVQQVAVRFTDGVTGRSFEARGAVAVTPKTPSRPATVRMILVGPGGLTAFDAWATSERYRLYIPPLELLRRGGPGDDTPPVGFLRRWFLDPLEGRLVAARPLPGGGTEVLLGEGAALDGRLPVQDLTSVSFSRDLRRGPLTWRRQGSTHDEVTAWAAPSGALFGVGARARYRAEVRGHILEVDVRVEGTAEEAADQEAFRDPDEPHPSPSPPPEP